MLSFANRPVRCWCIIQYCDSTTTVQAKPSYDTNTFVPLKLSRLQYTPLLLRRTRSAGVVLNLKTVLPMNQGCTAMSAGYLRCQQHSSLACKLAPHRSNLQTMFKLRPSNCSTSAASAQTAKGVRFSPRVYSTSSSHHVVHVHTPLPLRQVALGPNGEYVIAYNDKVEHELEEMTTVARAKSQGPSEGKESKKPSLLWRRNLPYDLQQALAGFRSRGPRSETAPITASEVTVCLSKVKWVRDFWVIRRVDGLDVSWIASKAAGEYFSSLHLTEGSKPTVINDLNQLNDLLYIAPSGCVAEIGRELARGGLPESLNDTLAKYYMA